MHSGNNDEKNVLGFLKKTIDKGVITATVKSGTYIETNKLKSQIQNLNSELQSMKLSMANAVYQIWLASLKRQEEINNGCTTIDESKDIIAIQQEEIKNSCFAINEKENMKKALYQEIDTIKNNEKAVLGEKGEKGEKAVVVKESQPVLVRHCASCGRANNETAKFCARCGNPL